MNTPSNRLVSSFGLHGELHFVCERVRTFSSNIRMDVVRSSCKFTEHTTKINKSQMIIISHCSDFVRREQKTNE